MGRVWLLPGDQLLSRSPGCAGQAALSLHPVGACACHFISWRDCPHPGHPTGLAPQETPRVLPAALLSWDVRGGGGARPGHKLRVAIGSGVSYCLWLGCLQGAPPHPSPEVLPARGA